MFQCYACQLYLDFDKWRDLLNFCNFEDSSEKNSKKIYWPGEVMKVGSDEGGVVPGDVIPTNVVSQDQNNVRLPGMLSSNTLG